VAYAIFAWLLLQIIDTVLPAFDAPDWVLRVALLFLSIGFVISLFIAWAFELTPEGIQPTAAVNPEESITPQTGQKLNTLVITSLVLALGFVVLDAYVLDAEEGNDLITTENEINTSLEGSPEIGNVILDKTIAVLPFNNLSSDTEQEYFADGLSEELINYLSQVKGLSVTGSISSFTYKNSTEDLSIIANALQVSYFLQGSVRKANDQISITVQLMEADNGFTLWTETFDRSMTDIFAVQDDIAAAVTQALSITLSTGEFERQGMTSNVQAYDEYLQGLALVRKFDTESILTGINHFERAVALDPEFALAWSRIAQFSTVASSLVPRNQNSELTNKSREAIEKTLQIAPNMLETLLPGMGTYSNNTDWLGMERSFQALFEQYGNSNFQLNLTYGIFLAGVGRINEAMIYFQRARRQEPMSSVPSNRLAQLYIVLSQYESALGEIENGLSLNGFVASLNADKAFANLQLQNWNEARAASEMMNSGFAQLELIDDLESGDNEAGLMAIEQLLSDETTPGITILRALPVFSASFGDNALALDIFRSNPFFFPGDIWKSNFSSMRQLPEFKDFVTEWGLLNLWQTSGQWPDYCRPANDNFECF